MPTPTPMPWWLLYLCLHFYTAKLKTITKHLPESWFLYNWQMNYLLVLWYFFFRRLLSLVPKYSSCDKWCTMEEKGQKVMRATQAHIILHILTIWSWLPLPAYRICGYCGIHPQTKAVLSLPNLLICSGRSWFWPWILVYCIMAFYWNRIYCEKCLSFYNKTSCNRWL